MVLLLWLENFLEQNLKDKCMVFCTPTFLPMILTLNPSVSASHQCTCTYEFQLKSLKFDNHMVVVYMYMYIHVAAQYLTKFNQGISMQNRTAWVKH